MSFSRPASSADVLARGEQLHRGAATVLYHFCRGSLRLGRDICHGGLRLRTEVHEPMACAHSLLNELTIHLQTVTGPHERGAVTAEPQPHPHWMGQRISCPQCLHASHSGSSNTGCIAITRRWEGKWDPPQPAAGRHSAEQSVAPFPGKSEIQERGRGADPAGDGDS